MDRTILKTLVSAFGVAVLIIIFYQFLDKHISLFALTLRDTQWHHLAKQVSLCANGNFITALIATGFVAGAFDSLKNGLTYRSKSILYICTVVAAAIVVGDVLKDVCGRARPPLLFEKDIYGFFPLTGDYMHFSFPSGHTLRIFALMTALGFVLPRLRTPALVLAATVGISRVFALKHYPSDVLFGAFIGITAAVWGWRILYPYGHKDYR